MKEISIVHQIGEKVGEIGSSADRVGFVIAQSDTAEQAVEICKLAMKTINIVVEQE